MSLMENILDNLNPAQKEAVTWPSDKPLLILAGAGSGKTRILTRRIAYLVHQGARAFNILGVTFTNRAAQEMKNRVMQMVRDEVWVSTFHATCLRILRMDGARVGVDRNFSMYDDSDQLVIIKECMRELNFDDKRVNPKAVRERISRAKDLLHNEFRTEYGDGHINGNRNSNSQTRTLPAIRIRCYYEQCSCWHVL